MPWWVFWSSIASLSLWLVNEKMRNYWRGVDELRSLHLLHHTSGQMHMYLIASSINITNKCNAFGMYCFKPSRMVWCLDLCVFWGCNLPIQLILKSSDTYLDRLVDHFHHVPIHVTNYTKYVTFHAWKIDLHIFLHVIYQYSCYFV